MQEFAQDLVAPTSSQCPSTLASLAPHLDAELNTDKSLATPPGDLASAATGPFHASNAAVLQPVPYLAVQAMQQLVQPSPDAELESAIETIIRAPKSEADHADPAEHEPAKLAPQPDAKPVVQPLAVQTAEPIVARAATVVIAPDAAMSVHVHLADSAPASPVTPSSSSVESAAPITPSWAIEARHVPFQELVGSPSPVSSTSNVICECPYVAWHLWMVLQGSTSCACSCFLLSYKGQSYAGSTSLHVHGMAWHAEHLR